jgi:hypothetical protein
MDGAASGADSAAGHSMADGAGLVAAGGEYLEDSIYDGVEGRPQVELLEESGGDYDLYAPDGGIEYMEDSGELVEAAHLPSGA